MLTLVEPLVDAAIASLRAGLNDVIDAINLAHDDFELEHIRDDAYRPGGLATASTIYPFVEVAASDIFVTQPSNMQVAYGRAETAMLTAVWCQHVDDEVLYRSSMRYAQAVANVLATKDAFGPESWVESFRNAYRRNPPVPAEQLQACVVVAMQVVTDESPL